MRIGIASYAYFDRYGVEKGLQRMKAHGYDATDFQGFVRSDSPLYAVNEQELRTSLLQLKALADDAGIEINQTHGHWRWPSMDYTAEQRAERFERMARALYGCALLGCKNLVIHPLMPYGRYEIDRRVVEEINADFFLRLAEVAKLGYTLSAEDANRVFEDCKSIAQSKTIGTRELDTIVAAVAMQVPSTYKLITYVINSGNTFSSSAHVTVEKGEKTLQAISLGDGPIDAAFKALEQIVGHHYELDDFQIHAVTEGREAVGSALVKLRSERGLHAGQGVSTDIIGASIRAYLDALNKIVYEEGLA